jgi:hypothetical protein
MEPGLLADGAEMEVRGLYVNDGWRRTFSVDGAGRFVQAMLVRFESFPLAPAGDTTAAASAGGEEVIQDLKGSCGRGLSE